MKPLKCLHFPTKFGQLYHGYVVTARNSFQIWNNLQLTKKKMDIMLLKQWLLKMLQGMKSVNSKKENGY